MNTTQNVVYFMSTADHMKIGISKNLDSRIKQVQTGCPIQLRRVEYVVVENRDIALSLEKMLHNEFKDLNTFGEWFYLIKDCNIGRRRKSILSKFNINKIEILFDLKRDFYNERSGIIFDEINKIHFSDIPFDEKISKLNNIQNSVENKMEKELFLSYSKNTLSDMCKRYIVKNINNLKKISTRVENQATFEFKKEIKEKDLILQDIEKKKNELELKLNEIRNKIKEEEIEKVNKLSNKIIELNSKRKENFKPDANKVKKVFDKWDFLLNKSGAKL